MVLAHAIGRGAPELVRFWGEAPLVREPDVTVFGVGRLDPAEQEFLSKSPMRYVDASEVESKGGAAAATEVLVHSHADTKGFVLHLDVDVISSEELPAVNLPATAGLNLSNVQAALNEFVGHQNLLAWDVAQYNPDKDPDGSGAKKIVEVVLKALSKRIESQSSPTAEPAAETPETSSAETAA
jgi:arginase